ncbi:hypothetical protein BH23ACT12_BH23ACT12_06610 [soil metagenome]
MGSAVSKTCKLLAGCLILLLAGCSGADDLEAPQSASERLLEGYGLDPDATFDLPSGSRIVFFGDSITLGGTVEYGYVTLVEEVLSTLYPDRDIEVLAAGVVGDKASDLILRLRRDVLAKNPTHVVIYVGVNDVASTGPSSAALQAGARNYREQLAGMVESITHAGAEVMLCTPTVIGEDVEQGTLTNYGLELYATEVRELAEETSTGLCDLRSAFARELAGDGSTRRTGTLTVDGIHLNAEGNRLAARTILRAFASGPGDPTPSPFVVPTVSPQPQPPKTPLPAIIRPTPRAPVEPSPAEEATAPDPQPSPPAPSPEESTSPVAVQTPKGFPFEPVTTDPTPSE